LTIKSLGDFGKGDANQKVLEMFLVVSAFGVKLGMGHGHSSVSKLHALQHNRPLRNISKPKRH
jgi:hypothetical protein